MDKRYVDKDHISKRYPYKTSVAKIAREMGVVGRIRLIAHYSNVKTYRADKSGYEFCIIEIY